MEDKELFDFFKNKSATFDEMPSDEVWNKIQTNIVAPKSTTFFSIAKVIILSTFILATAVTIGILLYTNSKTIIEDEIITPKDNILSQEPSSTESEIDILKNPAKADTLKPKKVLVKKSIIVVKSDTITVLKRLHPFLKTDSIKTISPIIEIDSLKIKPPVKGNQLLFETKKSLTKTEFDSFVQKILEETKTNYGTLVVIKAKGHKLFRQIVKFPEKLQIPQTIIEPSHYTSEIIRKDSLLTKDSLYFNLKK
ncbi:hypothetical protein J2X31_003259 [Flavobacterium arsenatis]|uniref:Uncharacterized protein n=1 Tax=Flavobacterium arsenatis TaxID=1484332 RepID=A0ABU1TTN3_9FLAO|nr:hypothetical protein [Flavobacterium arsenatis]MDR6969232.1 hypothetical protein [Flavobacterium arsenatis]